MLHRIREGMKVGPLVAALSGTIAADGTWIGGDPKNRQKSHDAPVPFKPSQDNAKTDKTRIGEVRSRIIPDVTGPTMRKAIAEQVDMGASTACAPTRSAGTCPLVSAEFTAHETVNHTTGEYVRSEAIVNQHGKGSSPS